MAVDTGRRQEPPKHIEIPKDQLLTTKVYSDPFSIDQILRQFINDEPLAPFLTLSRSKRKGCTLAEYLYDLLENITSHAVTPELHWGADPTKPPSYYKSCLVWATALGRALSIAWEIHRHISSDTPARRQTILNAWPYPVAKRILDYADEHANGVQELCDRLWESTRIMLVQGLFSSEPSTGARYAAALVLMTASVAIQQGMQTPRTETTVHFVGRGRHWLWYDRKIDPRTADVEWDWQGLMDKLARTNNLPRHNTDGPHMRAMIDMSQMGPSAERLSYPGDTGEYISIEALQALDHARRHCFGAVDPEPTGSPPRMVSDGSRHDLTYREILEMEHFAAQWASTSDEDTIFEL